MTGIYKKFKSGTDIRGIGIGNGDEPLYMSDEFISKASAAFADFLSEKTGKAADKLTVAIGHDPRLSAGRISAAVVRGLALRGVNIIDCSLSSTPAMFMAVLDLPCDGSVQMTASHHPGDRNGLKFFTVDGGLDSPDIAYILEKAEDIELGDAPAKITACDHMKQYAAHLRSLICKGIGADESDKPLAGMRIMVDAGNGAGGFYASEVIAPLGADVSPSMNLEPDGNFPTCPYPNPEIREAMQKGLELCDKVHPDLLLGTDPDCDRCGTAVPDGKGGYRLITGNEMGIILLDYICRTRLARGTMPKDPVAVTTIVSTDMATPVAKKYGVELRRTLTGFKFIGEQIGLLEAAGEADRYIFGFEESYGYLSGAHVRDKDAVNATLLVCEAAAWYAKQGMTLLDAINKLYAEFGCYRNALHSFAFEGESGMHTMDAIMKQLRQTPPTAIGGMAVENVVDYNTAGTGLPKANVLEFRLAGGAKLMVRPSGTEPKIKVYLSAVAPTEEAADAINDTLGKAASALLKA